MRRAEGWIKVLMEVLYWALLLSIGLFITGLLYQLRNLSTSFQGRATILLATWAVGIVLASGIAVMMIATTYHAVRYEASVFEGLVSKMIVGELELGLSQTLKRIPMRVVALCVIAGSTLRNALKWLREVNRSSGWKQTVTSLRLKNAVDHGLGCLRSMNVLSRMRKWVISRRVKVERNTKEVLLNTYLDLVSEASDPALVERAVASLSYSSWVLYGDASTDQLEGALNRLMATDTSIRVRDTVKAQASLLASWVSKRQCEAQLISLWASVPDHSGSWGSREELRSLELTKLLLSRHRKDISRHFQPSIKNYSDILDLCSLSTDKFVARCLSIHSVDEFLGHPDSIFFLCPHASPSCERDRR